MLTGNLPYSRVHASVASLHARRAARRRGTAADGWRAAFGPLVSRRYLAALAVAACVVLGLGLFVRNVLLRDDTPTPAAPPSQAAVFQQLTREGQLRRMSAYVAERVTAAAEFVEYVPSANASGVRWANDTVVTTDAARVAIPVRVASADTAHAAVTLAVDSVRRDWVLVVGRRADGQVISATGLAGGRITAECAGRTVEEYVLGVPLDDRLAGAGLFNLEGEALGMAVRCGDRVAALPARELGRLLANDGGASDPARNTLGLALTPLDGAARTYFGTDSGLLVTAVRRGGPADVAGLRAGDVIAAVDGRPVAGDTDRRTLEATAPADSHTVVRRRGTAAATVRLAAPAAGTPAMATGADDGLGITVAAAAPARGVAITAVRPGSAAAAAGLQAGDRLLRVGDTPVTSAAVAERLLAAAGGNAPTFVVFDRDAVERGALLPARQGAPAGSQP